MALRVAFWGTEGGVSFSSRGFDRALMEAGENTGNLIFQHALWDSIMNPKMSFTIDLDIQYLKDNADILVIPAANQVNPEYDLSGMANVVEAIDKPVVVLGLGAQAPLGVSASDIVLHAGTIRYFKALSERSHTIGVRGEFTQEALAAIGVTNTVVTGCPSRLLNLDIKGADIAHSLKSIPRQGAKIAHLYGTFQEEARAAEARLAMVMQGFDHSIIVQTDSKIMRVIFDGSWDNEPHFRWYADIVAPGLLTADYARYLRRIGMFFSDACSWIDRMRHFDLVIGMRIHGAVAAIMGGTAGVCVTFDSRTLELAKTMGIPYVLHTEVEAASSLEEILSCVRFDADAFDKMQLHYVDAIHKIMRSSGLIVR